MFNVASKYKSSGPEYSSKNWLRLNIIEFSANTNLFLCSCKLIYPFLSAVMLLQASFFESFQPNLHWLMNDNIIKDVNHWRRIDYFVIYVLLEFGLYYVGHFNYSLQ